MKKIIKLLVLIFLLTSCNSIKEIELNDEKTNTSIDQSKNSNSTNTLAKSDEDKVEDDADSSKDEDSNKKNNSSDDKNKDGKKNNIKVNDKEEPKNNKSNKDNNQDKKPEVRDDKNSNQNIDKPKDTNTSGETNHSKPIEKPKEEKKPQEQKPLEEKKPEKTEEGKKPVEEKAPEKPKEEKPKPEKRPEDADITEGLEPNRIYYDGSSVGYLDLGIDNYNINVTQKYIDDGNVIATVTQFNPKDSEITYFSGHTYNYNNVSRLQLSSLVTITDANGIGYNYRIVDFKKYPAGLVEEDAPFIGGYHLIDLAGEGIGKESIVIQYCDEEDVPMIFFGLPE